MGFEPLKGNLAGQARCLCQAHRLEQLGDCWTGPGLLAKNLPTKNDSRVPMTRAEFLERAWKLANDNNRRE